MIQLDVDLSYLAQHYEIGTQRINQYGDKSIEDIMKEEAANGNKSASYFDLNVLSNPKELVKLFKLTSARNRYKILRNMSQEDLAYLMQFLETKDLVMGLNFFTKDKLMGLIYQLPKEKITQILFNKFPPQKFLAMIPEREMNYFFESSKIDKDEVMKSLMGMPPEALEVMMENLTGQPAQGMDKKTMLQTVENLPPNKFKKAMQSLDRKSKTKLILDLTEKNPDLFLEFRKEALIFPLQQLDKPELIKNMAVLEPEDLIEMMEELPEDLMAIVVTQIDPEVFADVLCNKFQDVLSEIAVA